MTDIIRNDVMQRLEEGDYSCEKELTLAMFSGKWKLVILCHLAEHGAFRFNDLRRLLPTITHKVLTNQLRELAQDGLITRTEVSAKPLAVAYTITPLGRSLMPIVDAMKDWGAKRIAELRVTPRFDVNEGAVTTRQEGAAHAAI